MLVKFLQSVDLLLGKQLDMNWVTIKRRLREEERMIVREESRNLSSLIASTRRLITVV